MKLLRRKFLQLAASAVALPAVSRSAFAQAYPTKPIARNSHQYRPLGLGYANLGTMLMLQGIPCDSAQGRSIAAAITWSSSVISLRNSISMRRHTSPSLLYTSDAADD